MMGIVYTTYIYYRLVGVKDCFKISAFRKCLFQRFDTFEKFFSGIFK